MLEKDAGGRCRAVSTFEITRVVCRVAVDARDALGNLFNLGQEPTTLTKRCVPLTLLDHSWTLMDEGMVDLEDRWGHPCDDSHAMIGPQVGICEVGKVGFLNPVP